MDVLLMTDEQILEIGFKALVDKLGPVGMVRFIHQFQTGTGDYTQERQQWVGMSDVETLAKNRFKRLKSTLSVLPKPLRL